jgi:hypothetical protein
MELPAPSDSEVRIAGCDLGHALPAGAGVTAAARMLAQ